MRISILSQLCGDSASKDKFWNTSPLKIWRAIFLKLSVTVIAQELELMSICDGEQESVAKFRKKLAVRWCVTRSQLSDMSELSNYKNQWIGAAFLLENFFFQCPTPSRCRTIEKRTIYVWTHQHSTGKKNNNNNNKRRGGAPAYLKVPARRAQRNKERAHLPGHDKSVLIPLYSRPTFSECVCCCTEKDGELLI